MRVCPRCHAVYITNVQWCGIDGETLVERDQDPLVGTSIERYQVVERLGMGGMGSVYRAKHAVIDREYAIKVLYGDFAGDDKFRARFKREAQAISKIRHPNIVQVEDFGTTQTGLTFLAMELVRGRTLEDVIASEAPLSPLRTASIIRQVVAGLDAAHDLGFVHRDVKPSNVMLTRHDDFEGEFVKILDFGAVSLRSIPMEERLTSIGHIIGTPTYMAPEQTQDPGVAPTADFYSVGCMMHEMLAGTPPFVGSGRAEVMVKHITQEPPPAPPSRGLENLIKRLLKKHPADRPQDGGAVVRAIDELNLGLKPLAESVRPRRTSSVSLSEAKVDQDAFHSAPTNHMLIDEESQRELRSYTRAVDVEHPTPPSDRSPSEAFPALTGAAEDDGEWGAGWNAAQADPARYEDLSVSPGAPNYGAPQVAFGNGSAARELIEHADTAEIGKVDEQVDTDQTPALSRESTPNEPLSTLVVRKRQQHVDTHTESTGTARTDDLTISPDEPPAESLDIDTSPSEAGPTDDVLFEPSRPGDTPLPVEDAAPTQVDFAYDTSGGRRPQVIASGTDDLEALEAFAASAKAQTDGSEVTDQPAAADADTPEDHAIPHFDRSSTPTSPVAVVTPAKDTSPFDDKPSPVSDVAATVLTSEQIALGIDPASPTIERRIPSNRERPDVSYDIKPTIDGAPALVRPATSTPPIDPPRTMTLPIVVLVVALLAGLGAAVLVYASSG